MSYISIIMPLAIGLFLLMASSKIVRPTIPNYEKKRATVKRIGIVLVVIAALYFIVKILGG